MVLADSLRDNPGDLQNAFQVYENKRLVCTARVQLESRSLWTTTTWAASTPKCVINVRRPL